LKKIFTAITALLLPVLAMAQSSLSGKVTDKQTGAALPGATVIMDGQQYAVTNAQGVYLFRNLGMVAHTFKVTYIGYQTVERAVNLVPGTIVDFALIPGSTLTEEVTVNGTRATSKSPTAFTNLSKKDIEKNNSGRGF
jgi:iron complex outermembrane receptor protein